jgi:hypothetical protein
MAAHDWAMWHLNNQSQYATHQTSIGPRASHVNLSYYFITRRVSLVVWLCHLPHHPCHVIIWSPRHMLTSSVPRVTLLVVTRVTLGLAQLYAQKSKSPATCHYPRLPCVACMDLPRVICTYLPHQRMDMPCQCTYGLYGLHSQ